MHLLLGGQLNLGFHLLVELEKGLDSQWGSRSEHLCCHCIRTTSFIRQVAERPRELAESQRL